MKMSEFMEPTLPDTLTPKSCSFGINSQHSQPQDIWGHLISQRVHLPSIDLVNEQYKAGRDSSCDIMFDKFNFKSDFFCAISKEHFLISRDLSLVPYIEDLSRNGTFINGLLLGIGNKCTLCNNDIIAIGKPSYDVYKYQVELIECQCEYNKKYKETRFLGRGAFGEVILAYSKETCHRYAVKKIPLLKLDSRQIISNDIKIQNEVKILQALKHPCIVHFKEIIYSEGHVNIVLEYMEGGELHTRILKNRYITEFVSKLYFYQMVLAVKYLHEQGITHRDLKPENILLASKESYTLLKITDFGLSKIVDEHSFMTTNCGTPSFTAPEILKNHDLNPYTKKIDIWSLGVILFLCLFGEHPFQFESDDFKHLFVKIRKGCYAFPEVMKNKISNNSMDIIKKMLVVDPEKRIDIHGLLQHQWISGDSKVIIKANQLMYAQES